MKLLSIVALLVFMCLGAIAQKFSLAELTKMTDMDWNTFDAYVTKKGFKLQRNAKDEEQHSRLYQFGPKAFGGKNEEDQYCEYYILRVVSYEQSEIDPGAVVIAYSSLHPEDYNALKTQATTAGFTHQETAIHKDATSKGDWQQYNKDKFRLFLISRKKEQSGEQDEDSKDAPSPPYEIRMGRLIKPQAELPW